MWKRSLHCLKNGLYKLPMKTLLLIRKDTPADQISLLVSESVRALKPRSKIDIKCIDNVQELDAINFKKWKPALVFIVPELGWHDTGVNNGYEIAYQLLTGSLKDHFFQLYFLSVLDHSAIKSHIDAKHLPLHNCFTHYQLTKGIDLLELSKYSQVHFDMIKALALTVSGRLKMLRHQFTNLFNDFKSGSEVKERLMRLGHELDIFTVWTAYEKDALLAEIQEADSTAEIQKLMQKIGYMLDELDKLIPPEASQSVKNKSYKVLIIEDEAQSREVMQSAFKEVFVNVETLDPLKLTEAQIRNHKQARNNERMRLVIRDMVQHYHVVVIDLLFADETGAWLHFNGLDVYSWVKEANPYAVIRIVTSLPREVAGRVAAKSLGMAIPFSHVITKTVGEVSLKQQIIVRSDEIIAECKEQENRKSVFKPYPKKGLFNGQGIPDIMYKLHTQAHEEFKTFYETDVMPLFGQYLKGSLKKDTVGWNSGKLPSLQMKDRMEESYFLSQMKTVFVHRLMVLDYVLKKNQKKVYFDSFLEDVLKETTNKDSLYKSYFHFLGFGGAALNSKAYGPGISLTYTSLLTAEVSYIANRQKETDTAPLQEINPGLLNWFSSVLCVMQTYKDWDTGLFGFNPYLNTEAIDNTVEIRAEYLDANIINNITINDLAHFLSVIIKYYARFEKLADVLTDYVPNRTIVLPQTIDMLYTQLMEK